MITLLGLGNGIVINLAHLSHITRFVNDTGEDIYQFHVQSGDIQAAVINVDVTALSEEALRIASMDGITFVAPSGIPR